MSDEDHKENVLRIHSPSFSLELEGDPRFILQSYDMIREDLLVRLTRLIQRGEAQDASPASAPSSTGKDPALARTQISSDQAALRDDAPDVDPARTLVDASPAFLSGAAAARRSRVARRSDANIDSVKARLAHSADEPQAAADTPAPKQTALRHAHPGRREEASSRPVGKQTMAMFDLSAALKGGKGGAERSHQVSARKASRESYVWVYVSNDVYNKVYVAHPDDFAATPLSQLLNPQRIGKLYLEGKLLGSFKRLLGEGKTMWSELNPGAGEPNES